MTAATCSSRRSTRASSATLVGQLRGRAVPKGPRGLSLSATVGARVESSPTDPHHPGRAPPARCGDRRGPDSVRGPGNLGALQRGSIVGAAARRRPGARAEPARRHRAGDQLDRQPRQSGRCSSSSSLSWPLTCAASGPALLIGASYLVDPLTNAVKGLVQRGRPDTINAHLLFGIDSYGYPSGHTARAAALAGAAYGSSHLPRWRLPAAIDRRHSRRLGDGLRARRPSGVHYPSDIARWHAARAGLVRSVGGAALAVRQASGAGAVRGRPIRPFRRGAGTRSNRCRPTGTPSIGRPTPPTLHRCTRCGAGAGRSIAGQAKVGRIQLVEVRRAQASPDAREEDRSPHLRAMRNAETPPRAARPAATRRASCPAARRHDGCFPAREIGRRPVDPRTADTARSASSTVSAAASPKARMLPPR